MDPVGPFPPLLYPNLRGFSVWMDTCPTNHVTLWSNCSVEDVTGTTFKMKGGIVNNIDITFIRNKIGSGNLKKSSFFTCTHQSLLV